MIDNASRIASCARTAEIHAVLAGAAAVKGDYPSLITSALNARDAADEAIRRSNQTLPVNHELRAIATRADLEAIAADAAVKEFESRSRQRRERALAPVMRAIREQMPGLDAVLLEDSQAAAAWDAVREALLLVQYRLNVKE
jgi:hypothetical protein